MPAPLSKPDIRRKEKLEAFDRLLTIMDELRENCPWDKKQTMDSLRHLTIEETYELSESIVENDMDEVKKELGDLMLHMVFYSRIASETNTFDVADVLNAVCDKLIVRHPHIYGDVEAKDEKTVKENWEKIKLKEGGGNKTVLGGVPKTLPAMIKAMRIQEKARGVGFDWEKREDVWEKVQEEMTEFQQETDPGQAAAEFGDLMFSLINYARFVDINPEEALERTNKKFISRFSFMEKAIKTNGLKIQDLSLEEMDKYWNQAKTTEV
jgi:XTP/dITP diphosphohydrolase